MTVVVDGQPQLGTHTVSACHQNRVFVLGGQLAEGAETAETAQHFRATGPLGNRGDAFNQLVTGVDIDTCVTVRQWPFLFGHGGLRVGEGAYSSNGPACWGTSA